MCKIVEDREKLLSSLYELNDLASFYKVYEIYSKIKEDQNKHFLSLSQEEYDKISYAKCEDHIFDNSKRIKSSFERYVRRQLEISDSSLSDHNLNYLGRRLRQKLIPQDILEKDIEILTGNSVCDFYKIHTEIDSCMNGGSSYKTEIYGMNPEVISLATYKNKVRALLWTTDNTKILDRIYPNNSEDSSMLKLWAERRGFVTRCDNSQCSENIIPLNDGKVYTFTLTHDSTFPYMDTFCYGFLSDNKVELSNKIADDCLRFQNVNGSYTESNSCYHCGDIVDDNNYHSTNNHYYCEECFNELFINCYECGDTVGIDDCCTGSDEIYYCEDCFNSRFIHCESCSEVERKRDAIEIDNSYYCTDCAAENFFLCNECEEYHSNDDLVVQDDEAYCQSCFDDKFNMCFSCNNHFEKSKLKAQDDELYCEECFDDTFSKCCICEKCFNIMNMVEQEDGKIYCKECLPNANQLSLKLG